MTKEQLSPYDFSNKERLFKCLSRASGDQKELSHLIGNEIRGIEQGQTSTDFLEILSGQRLFDCLGLIQKIIGEGRWYEKTASGISALEQARKSRLNFFMTTLEKLLEDGNENGRVGTFINRQRKLFGLVGSTSQLKDLADILLECFRRDLVEEKEMFLINFPGSFNPFPHAGHLEVVQLAEKAHRGYFEQEPRILVSTVSRSSEKTIDNETFVERLNNMRRFFINECRLSVIGLSGDYVDKYHRIEQVGLLSKFDSEQRLRILLGSDNFIQKVESSFTDPYSRYVLNRDNIIFVSLRPGEDRSKLYETARIAQTVYSSKLIFLEPQKIDLSGTQIRLSESKQKTIDP